jgi:hypothetical protein
VEPRAGLDDVVKRKFLTLPGLELVVQSVASCYTDYAIPAPACATLNTSMRKYFLLFNYSALDGLACID